MTSKIILSFFTLVFLSLNLAQAQGNASSYYRKIASEQRKLRTKQVNYYKTALLFTDQKRLDKGRDMIVTQIQAAQKNMNRTPAFKGDSALRNDYVRILDIYMQAYTNGYDSVQVTKSRMSESEKALKQYQDAFYYMEDLVTEAEDKWALNEEYFTGSYAINPMVDPTLPSLIIYRQLAAYVQDVRSTYTSVPFQVTSMKESLKSKNYDVLEDKRNEMAMAAEDAMIAMVVVGNYSYVEPGDENEELREDDYLYGAVIDYLEYIKDACDNDMAEELTKLDEARYDEDDKKIEKSHEKLLKLTDDLIEAETSLNEQIEKFVFDYVEN